MREKIKGYRLLGVVLIAVLIASVAGCTSSTSSNQAASSTPQAASTTANTTTSASASASATPSVAPTSTTTPTATPGQVYSISVSGPTGTQYGTTWTATIYLNGVAQSCGQLTDKITWYINGVQSRGDDQTTWGGTQCTMTHDANGLAGSPFTHTNVITATYKGVTSAADFYTDNEINPLPTATPIPTATGSFGQSSYNVANGTVITATVSNWQSNPNVQLGLSTNYAPVPMQSMGNGVYSYTLENVIILAHGSGSGGISLYDNGIVVAHATTTWTNPAAA
jgi:hypothetical protein